MTRTDLEQVRQQFANRIANIAGLKSDALVRAFAAVAREEFVGPGPWKTMRPPFVRDYVDTPDDNPVHLYDTVVVALDPERHLNNGEPGGLARWLDELDLAPGVRVLHIGCGVG